MSRAPAMTVGDASIFRVEELRIPNRIAYFTTDEDLMATHRHWLEPHFLDDTGGFDLVFQSWIVEVGGRVVLIDPCSGNDRPHPVPFFDHLQVPYIERMQASGFRPEDIEFVVCTHLHHDHCGWNTQLRDGQWVPTFPRAKYLIGRVEYDNLAANHRELPAGDYNAGVFERSVAPVFDAGLVEFVAGTHALVPGVKIEPAPGHTFGHQIVHLASAGREACFAGDAFHHPIQLAEPTVFFAEADEPAALVATRRRLVEFSADRDAALIAAHVPAPYAVRASRADGAFLFSAGLWP